MLHQFFLPALCPVPCNQLPGRSRVCLYPPVLHSGRFVCRLPPAVFRAACSVLNRVHSVYHAAFLSLAHFDCTLSRPLFLSCASFLALQPPHVAAALLFFVYF